MYSEKSVKFCFNYNIFKNFHQKYKRKSHIMNLKNTKSMFKKKSFVNVYKINNSI